MGYTPRFETLKIRRYNFEGDYQGPNVTAGSRCALAADAETRAEAEQKVAEQLVRFHGEGTTWKGSPKVTIIHEYEIEPASNFFPLRSVSKT